MYKLTIMINHQFWPTPKWRRR